MSDSIRSLFRSLAPAVDFCSLRFVEETSEQLSVRQDVLQPPSTVIDCGAMITIVQRGGCGYAATSDLSAAGLANAIARARRWAEASAGRLWSLPVCYDLELAPDLAEVAERCRLTPQEVVA